MHQKLLIDRNTKGMKQNLKKLFKIGLIQSKPELSSAVWFNIIKKEARIFRIKNSPKQGYYILA